MSTETFNNELTIPQMAQRYVLSTYPSSRCVVQYDTETNEAGEQDSVPYFAVIGGPDSARGATADEAWNVRAGDMLRMEIISRTGRDPLMHPDTKATIPFSPLSPAVIRATKERQT